MYIKFEGSRIKHPVTVAKSTFSSLFQFSMDIHPGEKVKYFWYTYDRASVKWLFTQKSNDKL